MAEARIAPERARKALDQLIDHKGMGRTSRDLGIDRATLSRAVSGLPVSTRTLVALEKIAPRVRVDSEFAGLEKVTPPPKQIGPFCWDLQTIREARDAQLIGHFKLPVRMAEAMRTDDALFTAYHTRLAPQAAIEKRLVPALGARGATACRKAAQSVFVPGSVLQGIHGTLVNHGIAIGYIDREVNEDGTRIDMRLTEWPLEFVREVRAQVPYLMTPTLEGKIVTINHADGNWIIFRKFHTRPWTQDAAILPAALVWAAHGNAIRDWAQSSLSHGLAKIMGELPSGFALKDADGNLTADARAFLEMMQALNSGDSAVGIRPAGSKTDFLANASTQWQVFSELVGDRAKAAARIYLGTDAVLGSVGGAPGVDISQLFGVATTKVQGDFAALEQGLRTGLYEPWTAMNDGDSRYAPSLVYQLPDPDSEQRAQQKIARREKLLEMVKSYTAQGMTVDQGTIDRMALDLGVDDPPQLATRAVPIALAPTDIAKVVTVNEARLANGLPALLDTRGAMTIAQLDAQAALEVAKIKAAATESNPVPAP